MRDDVGAAKAVVEAPEAVDDNRTNDPDDLAGLAHAPIGLTIATESPAITESSAISAFPVLAPPGACRYLQLDGVRQASCLALAPVIALAPRQVELVCLGAGHADCPRFVRAGGEDAVSVEASELAGLSHDAVVGAEAAVVDDPQPSAQVDVPSVRLGGTVGSLRITPQARRSIRPRPVTLVATGTLAAAVVLAVAFAAGRGGLDLSFGRAPAGSSVAAATPVPASAPLVAPSGSPAVSGALATPGASSSASPSAQPSGSPASPSPAASPDRLALLTPCPDQPNCYQYRIRRHDNLRGIASFFRVPYQTVLDLNPQIENPSLIHVGQIIILPPPGP